MVPRLEAAARASQPPLMFILEDPEHTEWNKWDIRLAKALQLQKDLLQGGIPIYWDRSERVRFNVKSYISKSKAAIDRAEEAEGKKRTKVFGKVFYAEPVVTDGGLLPTLHEFQEEQRQKRERERGPNWNQMGTGG